MLLVPRSPGKTKHQEFAYGGGRTEWISGTRSWQNKTSLLKIPGS